MMVQEIITYVIVAGALIHFLYATLKLFFVNEKKKSACGGCSENSCDHTVERSMVTTKNNPLVRIK